MGWPIIHGVVELGPVDFQIDAQTDEERAIAMRHVVHARVLLGQLAARSSNAPLLSRKVIMHDGTVIEVGRNANQYTSQYNAFARIRVRRGGEERKPIAKAGGPFIWIGLRDNRDKDSEGYRLFKPFMAIWEPGSPEERFEIGDSYIGGQILVPFPHAETEPTTEASCYFADGAQLVKAEQAVSYAGTCENDGAEPVESAIRFDPWSSVGTDALLEEGQYIPNVVTDAGLIGMLGGHDPTVSPDAEGWDDWEMSYILDPEPGNGADVLADPPGTAEHGAAVGGLGWPRRYTGLDDLLTEEEIALFRVRLIAGAYKVKLGIIGINYRPGEYLDFESQAKGSTPGPPTQYPTSSIESIPVTVKIVTGRGDYFKTQEFDVMLSVPYATPQHWVHRIVPGGFDSSMVGMPFSGGCVAGDDDMSSQPYDAWFSGSGPVDFGDGETATIWNAHDTGTPPTIGDDLSQYERAVFVVDPKFGAARVEDPESQPWGLNP